MRLFKNRPLCLCCAIYLAVSALCLFIGVPAKLVICVLAVLFSLLMLVAAMFCKISRSSAVVSVFITLSVLLSVVSSYIYFDYGNESISSYNGEECDIKAVITERRSAESYYSVFGINVYEINGKKADLNAIFECGYECDLQVGYRIEGVLLGGALEDLYGEEAVSYLRSDGYKLLFTDSAKGQDDGTFFEITEINAKGYGIRARRLNDLLSVRLEMILGKESGGICSALLLGNRNLLGDDVQRDFKRAGVSHLLALSGMHLSIILGAIGMLLTKLRIPRLIRTILLCIVAPVYLITIGCSLSAARAFIMIFIVYLSYLIGGRADSITNLFLAGTIIVMISPNAIYDAALWLSLLASFGIIIGTELFDEKIDKLREFAHKHKLLKIPVYLLSAIVTGICANVAVMLFMWAYFGEISIFSVITTLIATPLIYLLILIGLLALAFGTTPIAPLLCSSAEALSTWLLNLTDAISNIDIATIKVKGWIFGAAILISTLALLVMCIIEIKKKRYFLVPVGCMAVSLVLGIVLTLSSPDVDLSYVRNGDNEAVCISSAYGNYLIDVSDGSYSTLADVSTISRDSGNTVTEALILTHYHKKHTTSITKYMNNNILREIWMPEPYTVEESAVMENIIERAKEQDVKVFIYNDEGIELSDIGTILAGREYTSRSTHPSIYFALQGERASFIYVGAALNETSCFGEISVITAEYESIMFGAHGPIIKNRYSVLLDPSVNKNIFFANDTVAAYADLSNEDFASSLEQIKLVNKPTLVKIKIK